ncbi:hypothetical protein WBG78_26070 [Chryseolinea sp. T2]|uniref:hypothetical protein n=1 Tax=Chryseolinea sp. T2 TaxID=3129255 RepID=UPI00307781E0
MSVGYGNQRISFAPVSESEIQAYHKLIGKHFPQGQPKGVKAETIQERIQCAHAVEKLMFQHGIGVTKAMALYSERIPSKIRKTERAVAFLKEIRKAYYRRALFVSPAIAEQMATRTFGQFKEDGRRKGQYRSSSIDRELISYFASVENFKTIQEAAIIKK